MALALLPHGQTGSFNSRKRGEPRRGGRERKQETKNGRDARATGGASDVSCPRRLPGVCPDSRACATSVVARASSPWFWYSETIDRTRSMVKSAAFVDTTDKASLRSGISAEYDRSSRRTETTGWKPVLRKARYFHACPNLWADPLPAMDAVSFDLRRASWEPDGREMVDLLGLSVFRRSASVATSVLHRRGCLSDRRDRS